MTDQETKLPLPKFFKVLTDNGIPLAKAMAITGKIYKEYHTPSQLSELTDNKLTAAGVTDKEDRKSILTAFRKAGYVYQGKTVTKKEAIDKNTTSSPAPETSRLADNASTIQTASSPSKRKRKHSGEKNEFLPDGPEGPTESLEFNEVLDEDILRKKSTVINRAPVMTAWSMVVAERLGFKRDEALSIASVYTEMNAISKGTALGIFTEGKAKGMEAISKGSQPYVEIMGRRPLYQTRDGQWRALSNGSPVLPGTAFSYISRSFRQTTPYIVGALRLLAQSYSPEALNNRGWSFYADFRPQVDGWGKRSEVKCSTILNLRPSDSISLSRNNSTTLSQNVQPIIDLEDSPLSGELPTHRDEPQAKRARTMTLEEYEAVLDSDTTFNEQ